MLVTACNSNQACQSKTNLATQAYWAKPTKPNPPIQTKLLGKAVDAWVRSAFGNVSFWVFHDHHRLSSSLQTLQYVPASKSGSQTRVANFDHLITFNSTRHITHVSKSPMFCNRIVIYLLSFLYNFVHIHQVTCSQHTFPQIMAQVQFSMNVRVRLGFLLSQSRGHRWKESSVLFFFEQSCNKSSLSF